MMINVYGGDISFDLQSRVGIQRFSVAVLFLFYPCHDIQNWK